MKKGKVSTFSACRSLQSLPDISKWDIKNITDMNYTFSGCKSLKPLLDILKWETQNVKDMNYIFSGCRMFSDCNV